nr:hypothetical protein [Tanacetum cinerariifolium]
MHIEKNVCESLIGLLLYIQGKTKDGVKVRNDMEAMKIRPELAPREIVGKTGTYLPPACYTVSMAEKTKFCQCLSEIKVPSGYSANIKKVGVNARLERDIILTICELEMYFPPSFFDVMVHLVSHIVREIKTCGPTFLRDMYPFERYMGILKGYVRNRSRPEGCIIEGYATEEAIEFIQTIQME